MYLAKISNSTLTNFPFLIFIKLVSSSVLGMTAIWKPSFVIFATVNETPFMAIDPL